MRLIRAVLSLGGLADRFEVVLTAEDEEQGKPDPAVYLLRRPWLSECAPERCLAVEDSINGVRSAKAAGMVCVAVPVSGVTDGFEEADLVLGIDLGVRRARLDGHRDGPGAGPRR